MNVEDAEALFSAAYDAELDPDEQREFELALQHSSDLAARYREFCRTIETLKHADESVQTPDLLQGVQRRLRVQSGGRFYADRFAERAGVGRHHLFIVLLTLALLLVVIWAISAYFGRAQLLP